MGTDVQRADGAASLPALVIDAFRMVAGGWLVVYYTQLARIAPEVLGRDGVWPSPQRPQTAQTAFGWLSLVVLELPRSGLEVWFAGGGLLALLMAVGLAPRTSAGLLLIVSATTSTLLHRAVLDDFFAGALPFWLSLLPAGRTLSVRRWRHWRSWVQERVDRSAWRGFLAFFVVFFLVLGSLSWRVSTLAWGMSVVLCLVFLATELGARRPAERRRVEPVTLGVTIGWATAALLAVEGLALSAGLHTVGHAAASVLANVGLPRVWDAAH